LCGAQSTHRVAIAKFWRTSLLALPGEGGGCTPTPFQPIITLLLREQVHSEVQDCFNTPNKKPQEGRGPQTDKHLPPSPLTGNFLKKSRHLGLESISYLVHD
jgi:hypothetical protein